MLAQNDNQTKDDFDAGLPVNPCASIAIQRPGGTGYALVGAHGKFALLRIGMNFVRGMVEPVHCAFPTAAVPHPMCPDHHYTPPATFQRGQQKKLARPGFIRGVAIGGGHSTERRQPMLRAI